MGNPDWWHEALMLPCRAMLDQEWTVDPLWAKAIEIWVEYFDACETFDEAFCTVRNHEGWAQPVTMQERRMCNIFAAKALRHACREMELAGIGPDLFYLAKHKALQEHEAKWPKGEPYSHIR